MLERKIVGWKRICRTDLRQNYLYNYLGVSFYFLLSLFLYACAKMAGRIGSWDACVRGTRWAHPPQALGLFSLSLLCTPSSASLSACSASREKTFGHGLCKDDIPMPLSPLLVCLLGTGRGGVPLHPCLGFSDYHSLHIPVEHSWLKARSSVGFH